MGKCDWLGCDFIPTHRQPYFDKVFCKEHARMTNKIKGAPICYKIRKKPCPTEYVAWTQDDDDVLRETGV